MQGAEVADQGYAGDGDWVKPQITRLPAIVACGALLAPFLPPLPQQAQQIGRQHCLPTTPALAALDADRHALAVDITDPEKEPS
jgi:hypothetical protein